MKTAFLLALATLALTQSRATNPTVKVKNTEGNLVDVYVADLQAAYRALFQTPSTNAKAFINNEDGTVTVAEPRYKYLGEDLQLAGLIYPANGICHLYGFSDYKDAETVATTNKCIAIGEDGTLSEVIADHCRAILAVTCAR